MIALVIVGIVVLVWSACAVGGAADDVMATWAAETRTPETEATE